MTTVKTELISSTIKVANKVVAIAASKGGISALQKILSHLPADFPGAMIIIQHLSPLFKSYLADLLDRHTPLKVQRATDGAKLTSGTVYVAPPDYHVIVNGNNSINLSQAAKEHFVRPSAEYTFKSLAENYKQRAIAVVLTGYDGDGSEGVKQIKAMGGKVIAQDRETSAVFGMPQSAIKTGCVDLILPLDKIADGIINMVGLQ
jgi:two-component system, chemotaxis family, protein-glutamate methylesterase/glutaminase